MERRLNMPSQKCIANNHGKKLKAIMETFDYHTMQINWQGKQYPFREIDLEDEQRYVLVSVMDLERVLLDANDIPIDKRAEWVDNKIAYYFESEEELNQSDKVLLNIIYG